MSINDFLVGCLIFESATIVTLLLVWLSNKTDKIQRARDREKEDEEVVLAYENFLRRKMIREKVREESMTKYAHKFDSELVIICGEDVKEYTWYIAYHGGNDYALCCRVNNGPGFRAFDIEGDTLLPCKHGLKRLNLEYNP